MEKKTKIKRKLKLRNFSFLCLGIFVLCAFLFYCYQLPIKSIIITGNYYVSDYDIISSCELKDYPHMYRFSSRNFKNGMKSLDFIKSYQIHRGFFGTLKIEVVEEEPIFYNRNKEKLVFASGKEITTQEIYGVPILVNYVPDELYDRFLKEMKNTNKDVLKLISELEYQPWKSNDVMIDDTRFYLRMNDGNIVYVNLINFDKLNNYPTIYSTLGDSKGILQLDSSLGNGITFSPF